VSSGPDEALSREIARLAGEVDRLLALRDELDRTLGDFGHEERRCGDALERVGGRSHELAGQLAALRGNIRLTGKDRARAGARLAALESDLAALRARLERPG